MKVALFILFATLTIVSANQRSVDAPPSKTGKTPPPLHPRNKRATCGSPTKLTSDQAVEVINAHNACRAREPASNMRKVVWNDEMASVAQAWADQCKWEHGMLYDCSNNRIGQNLYVEANPVAYPKLNLTGVVEAWNNERNDWNFQTATCASGKLCGHWTQLANAYSNHVGCAYALCPTMNVAGSIWKNALFVVCDSTPPGNVMGEKIYESGAQCSNCDSLKTGEGFKCENNLCSSCNPATDAACKCGTPLACDNGGVWSAGTCSCTCQKGFYGLKCEKPCSCADVAAIPCADIKDYCTIDDYKGYMMDNCMTTCQYPCNLPSVCTS